MFDDSAERRVRDLVVASGLIRLCITSIVFPSHTDTFGNVVLEALSSGVPAIVTPDGGPRYIIKEGETGLVAEDEDFGHAILNVLRHPQLHDEMRVAARADALTASWDAVFENVYCAYHQALAGLSQSEGCASA